ncbi:MAG: hypothetical protein D6715_09755 [Calditrichaeota bacterium]|nr:MAG: hypothetical protein D6715_09755 [Calditrichota bacterium]
MLPEYRALKKGKCNKKVIPESRDDEFFSWSIHLLAHRDMSQCPVCKNGEKRKRGTEAGKTSQKPVFILHVVPVFLLELEWSQREL